MLEVMYYRGKKNTPELHTKYADRLARLAIDRFYTDCDVKQLKEHQYLGRPMYRAKLGREARVLFVYLPADNGVEKLLLLEFLENHEYEQSEFLNGKKLSDVEKIGVVELPPLKEKTEPEKQIDSEPSLKFAQVHFYGDKRLELRKIQLEAFEQALKRQRSAALVLGQSGSGKTVLAMASLLKGLREHEHTRVRYLTQEEVLRNTVQQKWTNHPDYERYKESIECLQFIDFFKKQNKDFRWEPKTSKAELEKWLEQHQHRKKFKLDSYKLLTIYEEFRTISGYSKEEYCAADFGKKRCLIQDRETRETFFKAYENWQQYLQINKIILCDFSELPEQEKYDVIAVDEIHDFSNGQILQLMKFTERLLCFGDSRQQLADNVRKTIFIQQCLAKQYKDIYEIELPMSHRCPNNIMQFSGAFETMRRQVMSVPAKADKPLLGLEKQGTIEWKMPNSPEADSFLKQLASNADACIITLAGSLDKVREKYPFFMQILTPERVKGLEYKHVVLVNFLEDERFRELNKCLKSQGFADLDALLSACFVAATRATESLTFLNEKENAQIDEVLRILHAAMAVTQAPSIPGEGVLSSSSTSPVVPAPVTESTKEDWEQRARTLIQESHAHIPLVKNILAEHVKMSVQEIDEWMGRYVEFIAAEGSSSSVNPIQSAKEKQQEKKKSKKKSLPIQKELSPEQILAIENLEGFQKELALMGDINKRFNDGDTLLHKGCVKEIAKEKLLILLNWPGIDVNIQNSEGLTALDLAFRNDKKEIATLLLDHSEYVLNDKIMYATIKQDLSWLPMLDKRKIINWVYQDPLDGATPLMWVCQDLFLSNDKKYDLVVSAMAMGGNVSVKDRQGRTALFFACFFSNKGAIRAFLEHPGYPENFIEVFVGISWKTRGILLQKMTSVKDLLPRDVKENFSEIIVAQRPEKILEKLFALEDLVEFSRQVKGFGDINQEIFLNGHTLLNYACYKNLAAAKIQILLEMPGINVNHKDRHGNSALSFVFTEITLGSINLREASRSTFVKNCLETIKLLLAMPGIDCAGIMSRMDNPWFKSIDWNCQAESDGSTLLMWVCKIQCTTEQEEKNKSDLAIKLIQHIEQKKLEIRDNNNHTALFYACETKSVEIVKFFLVEHKEACRFLFDGLNRQENEALIEKLEEIFNSLMVKKELAAAEILRGVIALQQAKFGPKVLPMFEDSKERCDSLAREANKESFTLSEMSKTS